MFGGTICLFDGYDPSKTGFSSEYSTRNIEIAALSKSAYNIEQQNINKVPPKNPAVETFRIQNSKEKLSENKSILFKPGAVKEKGKRVQIDLSNQDTHYKSSYNQLKELDPSLR
jgi:hypothetical protein